MFRATRTSRNGQCFGDCPTLNEAICNQTATTAKFSAPIRQALRFPVMGEQSIVGSVSCLFAGGSPSAIARRVVLCVVDSINRVLTCGLRPHVGQEIIERLPATTNPNSFSTIAVERSVVRVFAASFHRTPRSIFVRPCSGASPFALFHNYTCKIMFNVSQPIF